MWRVWVRRGGCIGSWWGNRREGNHWGDLGVDGWIILGWICGMWVYGLDWAGPGYRQVADGCECGNEPSGYVKWRGNFLTSCKPVSCSRRTLHRAVSKCCSKIFELCQHFEAFVAQVHAVTLSCILPSRIELTLDCHGAHFKTNLLNRD